MHPALSRMPPPILIAGPTASGKSALALALARRLDGVVINADSQQVLAVWRVLTARPTAVDAEAAPHRLYGHIPLDRRYSVGDWLREIRGELTACAEAGRRAVVVGGTGLYFRALTQGLAPVPPVPQKVRAETEARLTAVGKAAFAADLAARDPETAAGLDLANPRRIARAWEVLEATGRGLAAWQAETPPPLVPLSAAVAMVLAPPRPWLTARCEARFDAMLAEGALEEARAVAALGLPADAPGLRAVGAPELLDHVAGRLSLADAATRAKAATRAYARRQQTWFANQMGHWPRLDGTDSDARLSDALGLLHPAQE